MPRRPQKRRCLRKDGQPSQRGAHFRSSDLQRELRSRVSSEASSANGKKGWLATAAKYGADFAAQTLARWRREHPSKLERQVSVWLDEFQVTYEREVQIGKRLILFADFLLADIKLVIEVDGQRWHGQDHKARDVRKTRCFQRNGYVVLRLSEKAIQSGAAKEQLDVAIHRRMFGRR